MPSTQLNLRTRFDFGPTAGLLVGVLLSQTTVEPNAAITLAVTIWVVIWWITEPIPIPVTALPRWRCFRVRNHYKENWAQPTDTHSTAYVGRIHYRGLTERRGPSQTCFFYDPTIRRNKPQTTLLGFMCERFLEHDL